MQVKLRCLQVLHFGITAEERNVTPEIGGEWAGKHH